MRCSWLMIVCKYDDHLPPSLLLWLRHRITPTDETNLRTTIACSDCWLTMESPLVRQGHVLVARRIVVCLMLAIWCAKHPPGALLQISRQLSVFASIEQYWQDLWLNRFNIYSETGVIVFLQHGQPCHYLNFLDFFLDVPSEYVCASVKHLSWFNSSSLCKLIDLVSMENFNCRFVASLVDIQYINKKSCQIVGLGLPMCLQFS